MVVILTDNLNKDHIAPSFSKVAIVSLTLILVALFLPVFLVVQTHNFWVSTDIYYEQASVKHLNDIVVYFLTDTGVYSVASTKALNDNYHSTPQDSSHLSPEIVISHFDINNDGMAEHLEVKVSV
jgi:uncharacterized membrane protein